MVDITSELKAILYIEPSVTLPRERLLRYAHQHSSCFQRNEANDTVLYDVPHLHSAPYSLFVIMFFCLCMSFRSLYVVMSFCLRILKSLFLLCPLSLYVIMSICLRTLKSPIVQSFQSLPVIMSFCLRTFKVLFLLYPLSSCTS